MTSIFRDWFDYLCFMNEQIGAAQTDIDETVHQLEEAAEHAMCDDEDDGASVTDEPTTQAMNDYIVQKILHHFADHEKARLSQLTDTPPTTLVQRAALLLNQRQSQQRTEAWYSEMSDLLTASELGTIFKPGRTRGQLVLAKASAQARAGGASSLPVPSELMTAFDWGIRFEPVVKMIYETMFPGTKVHDVGRLYHPTLARCAASPDGVVLGTGERAGRLIEIKCPVSRDITSAAIPADYYAQMQQQLEVTGLEECDYIEVKIRSKYSKDSALLVPGEALYRGCVWRLEKEEDGNHFSKYAYGAINDFAPVQPPLEEGWRVVEVIPWEAVKINLVTVKRDRTWWAAAEQKIAEFWADVELARRGAFVLPPSTRSKKPSAADKDDECLF